MKLVRMTALALSGLASFVFSDGARKKALRVVPISPKIKTKQSGLGGAMPITAQWTHKQEDGECEATLPGTSKLNKQK